MGIYDAIYVAIGMVKAYVETGNSYKNVKLENLLGTKYNGYEIGEYDDNIALYDTNKRDKHDLRKKVAVINGEFTYKQIAQLIAEALSYDMKNKD